jgi:hypothetical protein
MDDSSANNASGENNDPVVPAGQSNAPPNGAPTTGVQLLRYLAIQKKEFFSTLYQNDLKPPPHSCGRR